MAAVNWEQEIRNRASAAGLPPQTIAVMIASGKVESGLNPGAVGDNGSSFGFWQNHVGGAGGSTLASAKRYLNPNVSIENAIRRFRSAKTAADAYNVQRPANRADYIRKVQNALRGAGVQLNAPVRVGDATGASQSTSAGGLNQGQQLALRHVFRDKPRMLGLMAPMMEPTMGTPEPSSPTARALGSVVGGGAHVGGGAGNFKGKDYRWLQRMGKQLFGLENDPGNSQTVGGRHSAGSEHYSARAIDFGTARNSAKQLAQWAAWAKKQGLDVLNEGDHYHVSFPGRGI